MVAVIIITVLLVVCLGLWIKNRQKEEEKLFLKLELSKTDGSVQDEQTFDFDLSKTGEGDDLETHGAIEEEKSNGPPETEDFRKDAKLLPQMVKTMTSAQKSTLAGQKVVWATRLANLRESGLLRVEFDYTERVNSREETCIVFATLSPDEVVKVMDLPIGTPLVVSGVIDVVTSPNMINLKNVTIG